MTDFKIVGDIYGHADIRKPRPEATTAWRETVSAQPELFGIHGSRELVESSNLKAKRNSQYAHIRRTHSSPNRIGPA